MTMTGRQALALAQGYIGCDRTKFRSKYQSMTGVDFGAAADWCCGFASCVVVGWGGARLPGLPSLWCPDARRAATSAGRQVSLADARPGDVVYFEWSGNDNADHVGIFESYDGGVLTTVDGNVSNRVGRRSRTSRDWKRVWVVRPEYAAEPASSDAPAARLLVDGIFGAVTCRALQAALQARGYYKGFEVDGVFGPLTKRAYQQFLRDRGFYDGVIDGVFGVLSVKAEQSWLRSVGCYDRAIDGARGVYTKKGLQMALNGGKL